MCGNDKPITITALVEAAINQSTVLHRIWMAKSQILALCISLHVELEEEMKSHYFNNCSLPSDATVLILHLKMGKQPALR